MALSATFTANFSSFYDAVDKADAKLKDFGAGADKVGSRLTAMGNQFSGVKIIQDATLMAKAVDEIGGVTKLTEKELAKLGSTANEAVAKMKALGMDVPKNLQQIADKTKDANKSTTDWMGTLTKVAGAVGIAFSVDAITGFIGGIFDAASAVKDLSNQWGVSTKAVQQWTGAAKGSGVEAATVGKSIQFLTEKLSESSEEYTALLKNIGLSADALAKMPKEDAYKEVIKAIAGIKDETLQYNIALGIVGPAAKELIGAIRDGFLDAADAQGYMADETIKRLTDAQSQWEKFKNAVVIYSGEMLGAVAASTQGMTGSWKNFFTTIGAAARDYFSGSSTAAGLAANLGALDDYNKKLKENHKDIVLGVEDQKKLGTTLKTTAQIQEEVRKKAEALKKAQAEGAKAAKDAQDAQEKYTKSIDDLVNTFSSGGAIDKANLYVTALRQSIPVQQMTTQQQVAINKVMWEAIVAFEAAGQRAPKAMYDVYTATAKAAGAIKDLQESLPTGDWMKPGSIDLGKAFTLDTVPIENQLDKLQLEFEQAMREMGAAPVKLESFETSIDKLAKSFGQLGQITGGVFGDIVGDIGTTIGSMELAHEAEQTFQAGVANFNADNYKQGLTQMATGGVVAAAAFLQATQGVGMLQGALQGAAVGAMFGPYGAAAGAAAGALRGFFNEAAKKRELQNLKDELFNAAGGLELLITRARMAGDEMAFFAIVNAESGQALEAAVGRLNAALDYQNDAMDLAIQTAEKYGFTIEELGPAMQRQELDKQAQQLYQDWQVLNSAGLDTVLITEKMAEAVNDYVNKAVAMGVEVPTAMRPMLEAMARSGELLDENGEAITDLEDSGINFALTMSDGFKLMVNEVKKLTEAITRGLGIAIAEIPQPKIQGKVTWDVDKPPTGGQTAPSQPHEVESYQHGTDGFRNFGKGTPVILHGWEAVVPRGDAGAFATVSSTGGAPAAAVPSIIINAQGAFFDTPDSLQRLATKVSDALTAKYSVMGKLRAAV